MVSGEVILPAADARGEGKENLSWIIAWMDVFASGGELQDFMSIRVSQKQHSKVSPFADACHPDYCCPLVQQGSNYMLPPNVRAVAPSFCLKLNN